MISILPAALLLERPRKLSSSLLKAMCTQAAWRVWVGEDVLAPSPWSFPLSFFWLVEMWHQDRWMLCPKGMCIIHDVLTLMAGCASECVLAATHTYRPVCAEFPGCECDDGLLP